MVLFALQNTANIESRVTNIRPATYIDPVFAVTVTAS